MVDGIVDRFRAVQVWQRAGERAPHKPLLLLLALGRLSRGVTTLPFAECEGKLTELLREFGPSRRSYHPEYPFWRLRNDGIWTVTWDGMAHGGLPSRASNNDPPRSALRAAHAIGAFPEDLQRQLQQHPELISQVAQEVLAAHFPESLHSDILDAVGLTLERSYYEQAQRRRRDPNFRNAVLQAYGYRCGVCGMDLRIANLTVGLEAAHIKWHTAQGPDIVANGVSLCSLHHKLFDLGAFTIDAGRQVLVSEQVTGTGEFEQVLLRHHGRHVAEPVRREHRPLAEFVVWHRDWVFKEQARPLC
jgi:putative restriction endonuclease